MNLGSTTIIESILVTSPQGVESSVEISDDMRCGYRYTAAAIHNNLLLLFIGGNLYLYSDIRSGKQLWNARFFEFIPGVLEWRCDKHAKYVANGATTHTINMW